MSCNSTGPDLLNDQLVQHISSFGSTEVQILVGHFLTKRYDFVTLRGVTSISPMM